MDPPLHGLAQPDNPGVLLQVLHHTRHNVPPWRLIMRRGYFCLDSTLELPTLIVAPIVVGAMNRPMFMDL